MTDEVIRLIEAGDADAAVARVEREGTPREVAPRFHAAVRELYWHAKHLASVEAIARAGIAYCLAMMAKASAADDADFFGTQAKMLANDLASFTWPGWDEVGISPTERDIAIGFEAARLNLRLALELHRPEESMQKARWLLGAHLIAAGEAGAALEQFQQCSPETNPLFAGYVLLARVLLHQAGAEQEFDELLAAMRARGGDQETFIESQLATARRVFGSR